MTDGSGTTVPHYNWKDIPERELRQGLSQRVFRGNGVLVGYNLIHPGLVSKPHSHEYEQIFQLLKGRLKLHVGDQVIECTEGTIVRIPPNVEHWAEPPAPEDGVALNMDIWTPIRPDYAEHTSYQTDKFDD